MRDRYTLGISYGRIPIRDAVVWFASRMELKLRKNDHKKHWSELNNDYLHGRIYDELIEMEEETHFEKKIDEGADSANFIMMEADNLRAASSGELYPLTVPREVYHKEDVRRSMKRKGLDQDKIDEILTDLESRSIFN